MTQYFEEAVRQDGVVLAKNILEKELIDKVRDEYDRIDKNLKNKDVYKHQPIVVFWTHKEGEQKRIAKLKDMPEMNSLIRDVLVPFLKNNFRKKIKKLLLLETIIFKKPPVKTNTLHWHQDVAYFPIKPNNQLAVWFPLEIVTKERGAMCYAIGSHKGGARGSVNLHTREKFDNEDRELIPEDPEKAGYEVRIMEMTENDLLVHDGYTWHRSGPNCVDGHIRRGVSVRFMVEDVKFDPRPGQGAAFTKQIDIQPGQTLKSSAFPEL
jgi:ectoine hydroxylase-related dioxygenase (phytanoyl-CoA dioxygenase family)